MGWKFDPQSYPHSLFPNHKFGNRQYWKQFWRFTFIFILTASLRGSMLWLAACVWHIDDLGWPKHPHCLGPSSCLKHRGCNLFFIQINLHSDPIRTFYLDTQASMQTAAHVEVPHLNKYSWLVILVNPRINKSKEFDS